MKRVGADVVMDGRRTITRMNACDRKTPYATLGEAQRAMTALRKRGKKLRIYHCAFCNGYHLRSGGNPAQRRRVR